MLAAKFYFNCFTKINKQNNYYSIKLFYSILKGKAITNQFLFGHEEATKQ